MNRRLIVLTVAAGVTFSTLALPADASGHGTACNIDASDYLLARDNLKGGKKNHDTLWPGECTGSAFDADVVFAPPGQALVLRMAGPDYCTPFWIEIPNGRTYTFYTRGSC